MSVEISVQYSGDLCCVATHGPSGQTLTTDAPVDNGGKGQAFSPTDLVTAALGTCIITIMDLVARRNGIDLAGTRVNVTKEMTASPVRRIGAIRAAITFPQGKAIPKAERPKLERAAETCPVKQSLHPDVKVDIQFVYPD